MLLQLVRAIVAEVTVRTPVTVAGHVHQRVTLQVLALAEAVSAHLAHERRLVAMRRQVRAQILLASRRVRAQRHRAAVGGAGVAQLVGAQRLQVGGAEAALVAQQLGVRAAVRHLVVAQTVLPFEALVAVGAVIRRRRRVLGRVQRECGLGGEAVLAVGAVERLGGVARMTGQMGAERVRAGELLVAQVAGGAGRWAVGLHVVDHLGGAVAFEGAAGAGVLFAGDGGGAVALGSVGQKKMQNVLCCS